MMNAFDSTSLLNSLNKSDYPFPDLKETGFEKTDLIVPQKNIALALVKDYENTRNFPGN